MAQINKELLASEAEYATGGTEIDESIVDKFIGPNYKADDLTKGFQVNNGTITKFKMDSKDSKIYPGIKLVKNQAKLWEAEKGIGLDSVFRLPVGPKGTKVKATFRIPNENTPKPDVLWEPAPYKRDIWVYVPNSLDKNTPAPLLLINDGVMYEGWAVAGQGCCMNYCCCCCAGDLRACKSFTSTVDAMIGANKLKPMVVISLNAGGKTDPYEQRSLELNTRDDKYGEFLETEVIPLVEKKFNLQISKEAKDRAVIGTSSGAANAFHLAWSRPKLWSRVGAYSCSLVDFHYPYDPEKPNGMWDYHSGQEIVKNDSTDHSGLRVALYGMDIDFGSDLGHNSRKNTNTATNRVAAALKGRSDGVKCRYIQCRDAVHTDNRVIAETLPSMLEWIWSDGDTTGSASTMEMLR